MIRLAFHRSIASSACLPVTLLALAACGGGVEHARTVRDSAGVRIVEYAAVPSARAPRWEIAAEPELEIGEVEGAAPYQLADVTGAQRYPDGRIVIGNGLTYELRVYAPDGTYLTAMGRHGAGPGEFEGLGPFGLLADGTVSVYDWNLRRISVFGADGTLRSTSPLTVEASVLPVGPLADGTWLFRASFSFRPGEGRGVVRDTTTFYLANADGTPRDSVPGIPASEYFMMARTGRGASARLLPFGAMAQAAVGRASAYLASTDGWSIRRIASDGATTQLLRVAAAPRPVAREDIDAWNTHELDRATSDAARREVERRHAVTPFPSARPLFSRLMVDADERLWVREYVAPWEVQVRWTVFDRDGISAATLDAPANLELLQIGHDFVLALRRDELDVEHVRLYRLRRTQR